MNHILTGSTDIYFPNAQCQYTDPDIFFPKMYNKRESISRANREAIKICGTCEYEIECSVYAIVNPELEGIWGGTTMADRKAIRRKLNIPETIYKEGELIE